MLLLDTMFGKVVHRAPVVPKIWLDLAANLLNRNLLDFSKEPAYASQTVVEAAILAHCDGARVFLFPKRDVRQGNDGKLYHWKGPCCLGRVDQQGGWATLLDDPSLFDFEDPCWTICYQLFKSNQPIISCESDLEYLRVPSLETYHQIFDGDLQRCQKTAEGKLDLIGDCNSGTLPFCVSLIGMTGTLLSIYDNPKLLHAMMEKGISIAINQAKFFLDNGIRLLRYNDSVANMNVISPGCWRDFVAPYIKRFCEEIHNYCSEAKVYCHICGNVMPIIDDLVACGLDCIAPLDPLGGMSISDVRNHLGKEFMLMGGVNTLSFINKSVEDLQVEAVQCIREGFCDGHYAVGSGCVVPRSTSLGHLRALASASRYCAER